MIWKNNGIKYHVTDIENKKQSILRLIECSRHNLKKVEFVCCIIPVFWDIWKIKGILASYCHRETFYGKIALGQGKAEIPARLEVYLMKTINSKIVNTPYDDVFRTLLNDCSMLVRIFEYATQIALDQGEIIENTLKVEIPRSAILFLRSTESTPDKMRIEMITPGGTVSFDIPVMKAQRYGIEEIFEKNLLFLIPFYIFSHESRFEEYNSDKDKLEILKAEYADIMSRLDQLLENGSISAYTRKIIMEMSDKVLENIAQKFEHVREGVKSVMGGKVLEHEAKTILREGWKQGREQGREEGREQGRREGEGYGRMEQAKETAFNLRTIGLEEETIAKMVNVPVSVIKEWFAKVVS